MLGNTVRKDIRTLGYVLKRTNYGEADRILNLITPQGKISAIAKGVRKEKSKLAGGIEMFTLTDFNIHLGRGEFGVVTGAKMMKHYGEIVKDFGKMELAAMMLKKINKTAENSDNAEYFNILDQSLAGLNAGENVELVEAWFLMNLTKAMGEEINLYRDTKGEKLVIDVRYVWDAMEGVFMENKQGEFGADEIKMLRLVLAADLNVVKRVKLNDEMANKIARFARVASRI
ncbi:DNA repair protein RecO [Candidatus Saccharibacteria bacterium]|nr:DNA repair protein RecO [Candidatus Saccharibacteria bacterium]